MKSSKRQGTSATHGTSSARRPSTGHGASRGTSTTDGFAHYADENPFPVLRVSADGTLVGANQGSWLLLEHWKTAQGQPVPAELHGPVQAALRTKDKLEVEVQIGFKTVLLVIAPVDGKDYVNVFGLDVTSRKQAERRLLINSQVFESASEGVVITDADGRILDVNSAFSRITGYSREEILGENIRVLQSGRHDAAFYQQFWEAIRDKGTWQGEIWDRKKNGEVHPKWLSVSAVTENGRVSRFIGLFSDISVMKKTQEQLYEMAHYDSLTGLPNRRYFLDRLKESLERARRTRESLALMFVDLDGFKLVNDNLGHHAGDQLLVEIANRLKQRTRESDTVARMGGDEFTVILTNVMSSHAIVRVARKILGRVSEAITLDGTEVFLSSSIGIAVFPDDGADVEGLLQAADTALYKAKDLGKNGYQFFSPEMNQRAVERLTLQSQIRQGLAAKEFIPYYQPQLDIQDCKVSGIEALARWQSATVGTVSPEQFIPFAEETGLIHEVGMAVLRRACMQGAEWLAKGMLPARLGINISAHQLRGADFITSIESVLGETGFPAERLEVELTESILVEDIPGDVDKLRRLKKMRILLTIDDFGAKYSSFAYLRRLPLDRLKLDRSFVQDLPADGRASEIVTAIVAMARSLGLDLVAEGVETREQAALLRDLGCSSIQGYFCSRPFPAEGFASFLERACKD
jgi:diguanylate cyclase (GGDEF)-like protein/PAS domain S-box-containing protein